MIKGDEIIPATPPALFCASRLLPITASAVRTRRGIVDDLSLSARRHPRDVGSLAANARAPRRARDAIAKIFARFRKTETREER